jgi:hypothetical protein
MPKTAIDEHRDLRASEDDVGPASQPGHRRDVLAEAKPAPMQQAAERALRVALTAIA